jgi:hypothetical protein
MTCEHVTHPEHWPGDSGDTTTSLAGAMVCACIEDTIRSTLYFMASIDGIIPSDDHITALTAEVMADPQLLASFERECVHRTPDALV